MTRKSGVCSSVGKATSISQTPKPAPPQLFFHHEPKKIKILINAVNSPANFFTRKQPLSLSAALVQSQNLSLSLVLNPTPHRPPPLLRLLIPTTARRIMGSDLSRPVATTTAAPSRSSSSSVTQCDAAPSATANSAQSSLLLPPPPPPEPTKGTASTAPPPPPPTVDGTKDDDSQRIAQAAQQASLLSTNIPNPGPFEQATMDVKRLITLDTFDGFRCDINKQVSPFMAAVHSFWLGTSMIPPDSQGAPPRRSVYTFLTQVADDQGLFMARIDPHKWSIDGRIHRAILGGLALGKLQVSVSPPSSSSPDGSSPSSGNNDQLLAEIDFGGLTWTANLKYGSMGGGIVYGCNYYQALTSSLSMGGEGMYIGANHNLLGNYLLKYTLPAKTGDEDLSLALTGAAVDTAATSSSTATSPASPTGGGTSTFCVGYNAGQQAATIGYRRVVTPNRVQLASELQFSPFTLDSRLLLGAEFKLSRSKMALCVDASDGRIQTLLETKLGMTPGSPTLNFSADVNHWEDEMRFGYGINIEG